MMETAQIIQVLGSSALFLGVWACFRKVLTPFINNVEERQARTFGDEHDAQEMRQKMKVLDAEIEELLRHARHEGAVVRDEKIAQAKAQGLKLVEQAEALAKAELEQGEGRIRGMKESALREVPGEVEKLARLVVERALAGGGVSSDGSGSKMVH